jgi:hypothetical protein
VVPEQTFHQPGFGMVRIHLDNPVEKNLRNVPSFFRHCPGGVTAVDTDHIVTVVSVDLGHIGEKSKGQHVVLWNTLPERILVVKRF